MISWGIGRWVLLESEVVFGTRQEERRDVFTSNVFSYCIGLSHGGGCG